MGQSLPPLTPIIRAPPSNRQRTPPSFRVQVRQLPAPKEARELYMKHTSADSSDFVFAKRKRRGKQTIDPCLKHYSDDSNLAASSKPLSSQLEPFSAPNPVPLVPTPTDRPLFCVSDLPVPPLPRPYSNMASQLSHASQASLPPDISENTDTAVGPSPMTVEAFLQQSFVRTNQRVYGSKRKRDRHAHSNPAPRFEEVDDEISLAHSGSTSSTKRVRIPAEESPSASSEDHPPPRSRRTQPSRAAKTHTQDIRVRARQIKAKQTRSRVPLKLRLARAGRRQAKVADESYDDEDHDHGSAGSPAASPVTPIRPTRTPKRKHWKDNAFPPASLFPVTPTAVELKEDAEMARRALQRERAEEETRVRAQQEQEGMRAVSSWRDNFVVKSPGLGTVLNGKGQAKKDKPLSSTGIKPLEFVSMHEHEEGRKRLRDAREKMDKLAITTRSPRTATSLTLSASRKKLKPARIASPSPATSAARRRKDKGKAVLAEISNNSLVQRRDTTGKIVGAGMRSHDEADENLPLDADPPAAPDPGPTFTPMGPQPIIPTTDQSRDSAGSVFLAQRTPKPQTDDLNDIQSLISEILRAPPPITTTSGHRRARRRMLTQTDDTIARVALDARGTTTSEQPEFASSSPPILARSHTPFHTATGGQPPDLSPAFKGSRGVLTKTDSHSHTVDPPILNYDAPDGSRAAITPSTPSARRVLEGEVVPETPPSKQGAVPQPRILVPDTPTNPTRIRPSAIDPSTHLGNYDGDSEGCDGDGEGEGEMDVFGPCGSDGGFADSKSQRDRGKGKGKASAESRDQEMQGPTTATPLQPPSSSELWGLGPDSDGVPSVPAQDRIEPHRASSKGAGPSRSKSTGSKHGASGKVVRVNGVATFADVLSAW
ncbi:hypothetical protein BOTBODRAFT_186478 [Botryobasidium botryosum FD-172 SS1]|uniref:Uncharacterized protein n=1 Tax=Botryobasidium botryosum (strain FD-172 SS1) TaxID=930990 RepID=A0A067MKY8_BOTB1|nr:hypothetical protein BOTBODRAFT_186478 [Botryobasidium botryosum FD-172 SS1]